MNGTWPTSLAGRTSGMYPWDRCMPTALCPSRRGSSLSRLQALGARFVVFNQLDRKVYNGSITLRFRSSAEMHVTVNGNELTEYPAGPVARWDGQYFRRDGDDLLVTVQPNSVVEFRPPNPASSLRMKNPMGWRSSLWSARRRKTFHQGRPLLASLPRTENQLSAFGLGLRAGRLAGTTSGDERLD